MEATVRAACPKCQTVLRIPSDWVGRVVKCKNCAAQFRSKAKPEAAGTETGPLPADTTPPPGNAFDLSKPAAHDDEDPFGLGKMEAPAPAAAAPAPVPAPAAPGYPAPPPGYALPPGYPAPAPGYAPPPGYPYPPPGYPYPPPGYAPAPGYPAPPAVTYPYPAPPPGYPAPPAGYVPPPGYGYPAPPAAPAVPASAPVAAPAPPVQPTKPGGAVAPKAAGPAPKGAPVAPSNEFRLDPATATATGARSRYRRSSGKGKYVWIALTVLLTAGLVAGGVYFSKQFGTAKKPEDTKNAPPAQDKTATPAPSENKAFPRRLLFVSVTKYMYLNPLTQQQPGGVDKTKGAALRLAYDWRIPTDPANNQVFVLSDTLTGTDERMPMKNVITGAYQEFFKTSRAQDRLTIYFGGHAIEKDGKAYLCPMEAEPDGEDWQASLIPLESFYAELAKSKGAQKLVIWDVARYNPEKGRARPGSEPMSEALHKLLTAPPPGVQAVVTCKPGENALEYSALRPDGFSGAIYSGSVFLESLRFVAEPKNGRMKRPPTPNPADPLPVAEWTEAIAKRANEMAEMGEKAGNTGKQTVALFGAAPEKLAAPDPAEKVAARFDMPQPPKGAPRAEIKALETEFNVPALKPNLASIGLADFPFPADVMKDFSTDGVSHDDILKAKDKYPLRVAVLEALNKVRDVWSDGAGTTKIRNQVEGPLSEALKNEVKKEMEFWAIGMIELEEHLNRLNAVQAMRASEPKRWQAHYDFALATLKVRLAYMNEYNKLLGNLVAETLPALDAKVGQDGYVLVASETLRAGKEAKELAKEGQDLFDTITKTFKGTPWAIQAKQEKSLVIGLAWKPASLKRGE
jgi:hypothetical protein